MATTSEYMEYVRERIGGLGDIRTKKMFGEYLVYINEKPILLVCDNTVFVKKHEAIAEKMSDADPGFPYDGAKEHWVLDMDDMESSHEIIRILESVTPLPRPKKKKEGRKYR